MKELSNRLSGVLLGFVIGIIFGEILYYFTDDLVFFLIVLIMTVLGWFLGSKIETIEKQEKK